jgi:hypothetical protein
LKTKEEKAKDETWGGRNLTTLVSEPDEKERQQLLKAMQDMGGFLVCFGMSEAALVLIMHSRNVLLGHTQLARAIRVQVSVEHKQEL